MPRSWRFGDQVQEAVGMSLFGGGSVDGAGRGARSFVLAALRALHLAPLVVAVRDGDYPGIGCGKVTWRWGHVG
ncbi:MAG TPA: hypothetical protein VF003_08885 [Pseudonocardiaceae bacterium]